MMEELLVFAKAILDSNLQQYVLKIVKISKLGMQYFVVVVDPLISGAPYIPPEVGKCFFHLNALLLFMLF